MSARSVGFPQSDVHFLREGKPPFLLVPSLTPIRPMEQTHLAEKEEAATNKPVMHMGIGEKCSDFFKVDEK